MDGCKIQNSDATIVSLDAEKAFNGVNFHYFTNIWVMGSFSKLGQIFTQYIHSLC